MHASTANRMLLVLCHIAVIAAPKVLPAQDILTYINPGIRLGYVFEEGFTYSVEVTAGLVIEAGANASVGVGYQVIPTAPKRFIYVSGQGGLTFAGFSVGTILYEHEDSIYSGTRLGVWGGMLLLGSWEYYKFPDLNTTKQSIGLWGKLPILLFGGIAGSDV